jgi:anti-anti-sigma factor
MLVVNILNLEDGVLLRCTGRIVAGEEVNILRSVALANSDRKQIVLDLANVSTLDGAGIGMLAFLQGRVRSNGLQLRIQNPSHHVRELLELTNLDSVIEVTPSDEFQQICQTIRDSECENARAIGAHP